MRRRILVFGRVSSNRIMWVHPCRSGRQSGQMSLSPRSLLWPAPSRALLFPRFFGNEHWGVKTKHFGDDDLSDQQLPSRPPEKLMFGQALKSFIPLYVAFQKLNPTSGIASQ
jgi:hypothetical protein